MNINESLDNTKRHQGANRVHYNQLIWLGQIFNFILFISHNFYFTMIDRILTLETAILRVADQYIS